MPAAIYMLDGRHRPVPCESFIEAMRKAVQDGCYHVGKDTKDGVTVSTVFLVLDHNFSGKGPPVLFETMVFGKKAEGQAETIHDQECARYCTWDEAKAGHKKMVNKVLKGITIY